MVASLPGYARMFGNPFPNRGVKLGLTLPAGPDGSPADFKKAVRKSFLKAGVFAALQALHMPETLVSFLERFIDAVVGQRRVAELQDFTKLTVAHAFHGHIDGCRACFVH